jgi:hypothetical protein
MKKLIIISGILLTGCAALTKENAQYASDVKVCNIADSNYSSNDEKKWAYQEITKRNIHDKCSELASDNFYRQNNINSGTGSNSETGTSSNASAALLQFGAQMLQQSQPRALVSPPRQTTCWQSGIYINCNQY